MPPAVFVPPHPDLTRERLTIVGAILLDVWQSVVRDHNPRAGDGEMVFGVQLFERCLNRIRAAAATSPDAWLRSLVDQLHYVFTMGAVPLRIFKGNIRTLKPRYRRRRAEETNAHQTAFAWAKDGDKACFRLVIEETTAAVPSGAETTAAVPSGAETMPQRTARVVLGKYSLESHRAVAAWDLTTFEAIVAPQEEMRFDAGSLAPPPVSPPLVSPLPPTRKVESILPPPVDVKPAAIGVRKKPEEGSGTDDP